MGASDSKLSFRQGIFKLSEQRSIPADDPYWTNFWTLPESVEDVFSLFSSTDIRRVRDESRENLETLILAVTSRLFVLRHSKLFPHPEAAPPREALNCIRILTRILPFIYEADSLEAWEEQFFWTKRNQKRRWRRHEGSNVLFDGTEPEQGTGDDGEPAVEETEPLAEELIDTLVELLFFANFTLPPNPERGKKFYLAIWQSGVGSNTAPTTTKEYEATRMEILRLLLTLASKSIYTTPNVLPVQGVRAITYITTLKDKQLVLSTLCSLLNSTLKYTPATWNVPYDHVVFKDPRQVYVTHCLQLLLVLVLYPVPETGSGVPPRNSFRHFMGKIHRPADFQLIVDGLTRVLKQPLEASTSLLPGSQRSIGWAPEIIMLFWELLQCNKRFRAFITETDRAREFAILIIFFALQYRNDAAHQGIVRMCVFVLQTLSVEPSFAAHLNKPFRDHENLPQHIRIQDFKGSYLDFLISSLHTLIVSSPKGRLDAIYPALLAILSNLIPHATDLNGVACTRLMQLFTLFSSPDFLFANETNHELLRTLLEAFNAVLEHQYERNPIFVLAIVRAQKRFGALQHMVHSGAEDQLEQQSRLRKERAEIARYPTSANRAESPRTPRSARPPALRDVPELESAFAIGGDDEDEDEEDGADDAGSTQSNSNNPRASTPARSSIDGLSRTDSLASSVEDAVPVQRKGMSEKARGKLPSSHSSFSRANSSTSLGSLTPIVTMSSAPFEPSAAWAESWLNELPLQTIMTVIDQVSAALPPQGPSSTSGPALNAIRRTTVEGLNAAPIRLHIFEWSPLSLGWYESLLWGFIFSSEVTMFKGAMGIWRGTQVRLFRVQETAAQGPSLLAPRGAVDAVGSSLVQQFSSINLRGRMAPSAVQRTASGGVIRDV